MFGAPGTHVCQNCGWQRARAGWDAEHTLYGVCVLLTPGMSLICGAICCLLSVIESDFTFLNVEKLPELKVTPVNVSRALSHGEPSQRRLS